MPTDLVAPFVEGLRWSSTLDASQLSEVERTLLPQFPDPTDLSRELVRLGWLTQFQAGMLLRGRGQHLLVGQYVLLERLGEGGMGQVFRARHRSLDRIVALKFLRKEQLGNRHAVRRFHREIQAVAQLSHPNIIHAYDAMEYGGMNILVMEYVEGTDLSRLVKRHGPLACPRVQDYLRQAAAGLQHAHERGLVHRDIKPSNLLLTASPPSHRHLGSDPASPGEYAEGLIKILDLGLARCRWVDEDAGSSMTQDGVVMGTPDYIAPEQARSAHHADIRADLYSLGCTAYFMLVGHPPFPTGSIAEKLLKHQAKPPVPVTELRPDVPLPLASVIHRLLAKRPRDRFQTPAELVAALNPAMAAPLAERESASVIDVEQLSPDPRSEPPTVDNCWAEMPHQSAVERYRCLTARAEARPRGRDRYAIGVVFGLVLLASLGWLVHRGRTASTQPSKPVDVAKESHMP